MSYEIMKDQLKKGNLSKTFHFYGVENYLKRYYLNEIKSKIPLGAEEFNYIVFEGSNITPNDINMSTQTPPFMGEYKLIVLNDTGLFTAGSGYKDEWKSIFLDMPEYLYIIACEDKFDKRNGAYKAFAEKCLSVEFKYRGRGDIKAWITKILSKNKKTIDEKSLEFLLDSVGVDMQGILTQIEKLIAITKNRDKITYEDIGSVITRELFTKEYTLTDALITRKSSEAFSALLELEQMKYDPVKLLYVIASGFMTTYKAKTLLADRRGRQDIARSLGLPSEFLAKKFMGHAAKSDAEYLRKAIELIKIADYQIKLGQIEPYIGIETLCASIMSINKKEI